MFNCSFPDFAKMLILFVFQRFEGFLLIVPNCLFPDYAGMLSLFVSPMFLKDSGEPDLGILLHFPMLPSTGCPGIKWIRRNT